MYPAIKPMKVLVHALKVLIFIHEWLFTIVPADLCSAGIEYQDFQSDYFLFDFTLYL